jgi:hypothetical protein
MTAALDDVTKRIKKEPRPEEKLAAELVAQGRRPQAAGIAPTSGPGRGSMASRSASAGASPRAA